MTDTYVHVYVVVYTHLFMGAKKNIVFSDEDRSAAVWDGSAKSP